MLSDKWLSRYGLLENFTKCDGNGNAYNLGDYNSSFALRAVELISNTYMYLKIFMNLIFGNTRLTLIWVKSHFENIQVSNLLTIFNHYFSFHHWGIKIHLYCFAPGIGPPLQP